jgi:peptidoglycan hydrolase CwlO-like protein
LNLIAQQDKTILEEHEKDKKELEEKTSKVETELLTLENSLADLETLKQGLNKRIEEKNKLM